MKGWIIMEGNEGEEQLSQSYLNSIRADGNNIDSPGLDWNPLLLNSDQIRISYREDILDHVPRRRDPTYNA